MAVFILLQAHEHAKLGCEVLFDDIFVLIARVCRLRNLIDACMRREMRRGVATVFGGGSGGDAE